MIMKWYGMSRWLLRHKAITIVFHMKLVLTSVNLSGNNAHSYIVLFIYDYD